MKTPANRPEVVTDSLTALQTKTPRPNATSRGALLISIVTAAVELTAVVWLIAVAWHKAPLAATIGSDKPAWNADVMFARWQ